MNPGTDAERTRWLALYVLCAGMFMIVIDATIVNVALPSIKDDLDFTQNNLAWVVNAYLIAFGGSLLLAGRLGDLLGYRRIFMIGLTVFTGASLLCALSQSQEVLIAARFVQGAGGALASAVTLGMIVTMFTEPREQAKAIGVYGFVASAGGSIGLLVGGILTDAISWHWIFFVNVPIGLVTGLLAMRHVEGRPGIGLKEGADLPGAVLVTSGLMLAVYTILGVNDHGWGSARTLILAAVAIGLVALFVFRQTRIEKPLMPLRLFHSRNVSGANIVIALLVVGMFGIFFLGALYMQLVLGYSPLQVGLAFLPANVIMGLFSVGLSAKLVMRFGIKPPLVTGLGFAAAGSILLSFAPADGTFAVNILPSMILLGIGAGMAFNPVLLAAMSDVRPEQSGLASGIVNTAFMMGGALGLAVLASLADWRTGNLRDSGSSELAALTGGYQLAFVVSTVFAVGAAAIAGLLLRPGGAPQHAAAHGEVAAELD